jgi:hypothetical protein
MTSGIDSDLLADLGSRPNEALALFEFDIAGTTRKYAETWAASSTGLYEGYVIEAGQITRSVSDSNYQLPRDQASVTIFDEDRALEKILMGSAPGSVSGSAARIKIASRTRTQSKWFTVFTGVIDGFQMPEAQRWAFSLKRDDRSLNSIVKIPTFQEYDWPDAPEATLGAPAQVVYGQHNSLGTDATGMVPTAYVDDALFRYVISFGPITSVEDVYVDGILEPTANYSVDLSFFNNGRYWSIIDFTSDQGDDALVTVDCKGLTDGGMVQNPATQLEHFLTNFVIADWGAYTTFLSSAWLTTAGYNIDEVFFAEAETFLSNKQIAKGSRVITGGRKGIDYLNEWTKQLQISSFWTYGGKLAIRPDDHTITSTYISAPWFRQEFSPRPESLEVEFSTDNLIDEVKVDYLFDAAAGNFIKALTVKDAAKGYGSSESLQLHWRESVK